MKVVLAGAGAFGKKHLHSIANINGVDCVSVVARRLEPTQGIAEQYGVGQATTDLAEALERYRYGNAFSGSRKPHDPCQHSSQHSPAQCDGGRAADGQIRPGAMRGPEDGRK